MSGSDLITVEIYQDGEPSWWVEGAEKVIAAAKKHVKSWGEEPPTPTRFGIERLRNMLYNTPNGDLKHSPVHLLEQDCRKLLEWKNGGS